MYQPIPSKGEEPASLMSCSDQRAGRQRATQVVLAIIAVAMAVGAVLGHGTLSGGEAVLDAPAAIVPAGDVDAAAASAAAAVAAAPKATAASAGSDAGDAASAPLGFKADNEYTVDVGMMAARYPWIEAGTILVEPYRKTTLTVLSPSNDDNLEYVFKIAPSGTTFTPTKSVELTGTAPEYIFDGTGWWTIELQEATKRNKKTQRSTKQHVMCKYVRREVRALNAHDREKFFGAMEVTMNTDTDTGMDLYGTNYKSVEDFARLHNELSGHRTCDHMHGGLGFLPQHAAMTADFEKSLQSVDPSVSMVYWDYTIEGHHMSTTTGHVNAWYDSIVFNESWFGPIGSDSDHPEVAVGRFAYHPIAFARNFSRNTLTNAYGLMRAPWNQNNNPYLTRHDKSYGFSLQTSIVPTCDDFFTQMQQKVWSGFGASAQYAPHGSLHIMIGGVWGADYKSFLVDKWDYPYIQAQPLSTLTLARIWRKHWMNCPTHCSADTPAANCTCTCTHLDTIIEEGHHEEHKMIVNMYPSVAKSPDFLTASDGTDMTLTMLRLFCNDIAGMAPQIGDFMESASPSDPLFWPTHPTLDRMWQWRMINGMDDMSWSTSTCWGHNEDDVTVWHAGFEGGSTETRYTNADLMVLFDPTNSSIPYVYDNFEWPHCAEEGYPSDLIATDDMVDEFSDETGTAAMSGGLPGGGQGHAQNELDDNATNTTGYTALDPTQRTAEIEEEEEEAAAANATAVAEKKAAKAEDAAAMAADAAAAPLDPEGNVAPAPQDPLDDAAYPDLIPEAAAAEAAEREAFLHATRQAAALGLPPLGAWW